MFRLFEKNSDLVMVLLVVGILTVLFVPIPAGLLDFLILTNVSFAMLLLLLTFYVARPVEFSTFPSLLLIATLFRLSLNVATTRLILTDANAGKVISAIGAYVVGGNYVIGLIVFLILVVVQYVVVTNGAQRVSEVAARFTLDSMPGQQMSIDAELNMGFISQDEAKRRRKLLEKESGFYGAMDGASKFVKGDAIAGIIIMLINIVGGLVIGVMQMGLPWAEALHTFTLLTVGDGIVTQVPALVIAVGTGIIVTRSASDANLSSEVLRQLTAYPKTMQIVVGALVLLLCLPGIPALPVAVVAATLFGVATISSRQPAPVGSNEIADGAAGPSGAVKKSGEGTTYDTMPVEPVEVVLGSDLAPLVNAEHAVLMERVRKLRTQFANEQGMVLPAVRFRDGQLLSAGAYEIWIYGVKKGRGDILMDRTMAIKKAGAASASIKGIATVEPSFGLPAVWIENDDRDLVRGAGHTLVDPVTVFATHLQEILRRNAPNLLTRAETDKLLQVVRDGQPGLVEELVPAMLSISDIQKVLQELLHDRVSIRNMELILETLVDTARVSKDVAHLVDTVRERLGPAICQSIIGDQATMTVLTLHPQLELTFRQALNPGNGSEQTGWSPKVAEIVIRNLTEQSQKMSAQRHVPIVLCSPGLRRHFQQLIGRALPNMRVLSMSEVPSTLNLRSFSVISLDSPPPPETAAAPATAGMPLADPGGNSSANLKVKHATMSALPVPDAGST
jgi:flagellar biosynthesis protein FlhA